MNLVIFNMSNYSDWKRGVVNRNFFVVRELLKRPEFEKIVLVDFLAIQSYKKIFGKRRTLKYVKNVFYSKVGERLGLLHRIETIDDEVFQQNGKEVYLYKGVGIASSAEKVLDHLQVYLQKQNFDESNTVVWSYDAFLPEALNFPAKIKVFDMVDNWSEHASYKKESTLLRDNYHKIDKLADFVFTTAEGLTSMYANTKVKWIPNGVDIDHFPAVEYKKINNQQSKIGYVGTIQERIDFELIDYICKHHPDKEFRIIGPVWFGVQNIVDCLIANNPNVNFVGRKPYQDLPRILSEIDVAIIPHRLDAFLKSTNPMKMYDYLVAGKPVVTTSGAGTEMFSDIMYIRDDQQAFSDAINQAILEDSQESFKKRRDAVKGHSWEKRVDDMLTFVITAKAGSLCKV